jgi:hypothetical protein
MTCSAILYRRASDSSDKSKNDDKTVGNGKLPEIPFSLNLVPRVKRDVTNHGLQRSKAQKFIELDDPVFPRVANSAVGWRTAKSALEAIT